MFKDTKTARLIFNAWSGSHSDPILGDFFFKKSVKVWCCDPVQYSYWFISMMACGVCGAVFMRHTYFNPDMYFRKAEMRRNIVDRHTTHAFSLPFFNHRLRNWSQIWNTSVIDNEADYAAEHPWGIRPKRVLHYARFPLFFSAHKYLVDAPLSNHNDIEAIYREHYGTAEEEEAEE